MRLAPKTTELLVQQGEYVPGQGVPLFELRPPVLAGADWAVKRAFDVVVSALVARRRPAALAADRGRDQARLARPGASTATAASGVGEREFGMLKFRTMVADAAEQQAELEAANEATGALFKIRDDPRVTRVGRFLRRFSLDEMPQLAERAAGRDEPRRAAAAAAPRLRAARATGTAGATSSCPGMTGLWQISGRSDLSFDDLVRLDFYYLENWSIWLDISILAKTIPAVIARRGAYYAIPRR